MRRPDPAVLRLIVFVGILAATVALLITFRGIFQPLLLGLLFAYLFDPLVGWFEKRGRSRVTGVVVLVLLLLIALTGLLLFAIPALGQQVDRLADRLPEYQERIRTLVKPWFDRLETRYPAEFEEMQQRVVESVRANLPRLLSIAGTWAGGLFSNLLEFLLFLLNLVFVPVFAFYLLIDWPKVKNGMVGMIPLPYRAVTLARVGEVDQAIASFLRGQLTIAMILASINAIGLTLMGIPFGFLIGVVAGLANMIPYMSLVVGLAPAMVLCWAEYQSWPMLIGVVAIFSGSQLLEGTVLSPRILSKSVNLHPVWVMLAVIAGGSLFGFVGMLIAVPVAAAVQVFARHWLQLYRESDVYTGIEDEESDESIEPEADGSDE